MNFYIFLGLTNSFLLQGLYQVISKNFSLTLKPTGSQFYILSAMSNHHMTLNTIASPPPCKKGIATSSGWVITKPYRCSVLQQWGGGWTALLTYLHTFTQLIIIPSVKSTVTILQPEIIKWASFLAYSSRVKKIGLQVGRECLPGKPNRKWNHLSNGTFLY